MINEIIYWELYALVVSFFNGVLLAWIYDNIRAFRRIVRHKNSCFYECGRYYIWNICRIKCICDVL